MTKIHTTNYFNTFIEVAEDCAVVHAAAPKSKGENKTVAELQFEIISKKPYTYSSDEVLFQVFALRNDISEEEKDKARLAFFSKGQPCFRASPLTKKHGFGVHADSKGKIAIYGIETEEYSKLFSDSSIKKVKAMRTSKK